MVDEQKQNQGDNAAHNKAGIAGEVKHVLSLLDKGQIKENDTARSDFNAYKELDDVAKDFAKIDPTAEGTVKSDPNPIIPESMSRFCHEHEIDEGAIRRNEGMKLNQKVDSPADKQ